MAMDTESPGGARAARVISPGSAMAHDPLALLRLFHLVSPALPVGAYAYSQGLEYACHAGWIHDEATTLAWLEGVAESGVGTLDLPLLKRLHAAWGACDERAVHRWNAELLASRESSELRAEDLHLGRSLARVLVELELSEAAGWLNEPVVYATMFSLAAVRWQISSGDTLRGYLWSWCENQVLAAVKLVPLGQSAGQRLLHRLTAHMPRIIECAQQLADADIGAGTVFQVLASARHETQYTRLFRS
jgi:urease accessory protein